jgi:EAL domain-containing protein (putative c-di-GMP-specific phosphodiesterase class I)
LSQGRGRLETLPVFDREGRILHLACSLQLQLVAGAAHQPQRGWLALARRAQLLPRVDLLTVQLALDAIAADGQPRSVRLSGASWAAAGFVAAIQTLLQVAPTQARALSLVVPEPESLDASAAWSAAIAAWAPTGARLGLAQAAEMPLDLGGLQASGISFVTLAAAHLRGVAAAPELKAYAQGLLQLVGDLGLLVLLDGSCDPQDLDVLWTLGLGGAAAPPPLG